jgi:hypothetical protein
MPTAKGLPNLSATTIKAATRGSLDFLPQVISPQ